MVLDPRRQQRSAGTRPKVPFMDSRVMLVEDSAAVRAMLRIALR